MTDEPVPQETNLVTKDGDWLTFQPSLAYAPSTYSLLLVAYLEQYELISAAKGFSVQVLPCEAKLVSVAAQISMLDVERDWGADVFIYDIQNTIAAYT